MMDSHNELAAMIPLRPGWNVTCRTFRRGRVLDLACGNGRHVRLLAAANHPVLAVDRDGEALAGLAALPRLTSWSSTWKPNAGPWPTVLRRHRRHQLPVGGLASTTWSPDSPWGVLLYETFAGGERRYGKLVASGIPPPIPGVAGTRPAPRPYRPGLRGRGYAARPKPAPAPGSGALRPGG